MVVHQKAWWMGMGVGWLCVVVGLVWGGGGEWVMGGWQTVKFHRMLRAVVGRREIVDIICI